LKTIFVAVEVYEVDPIFFVPCLPMVTVIDSPGVTGMLFLYTSPPPPPPLEYNDPAPPEAIPPPPGPTNTAEMDVTPSGTFHIYVVSAIDEFDKNVTLPRGMNISDIAIIYCYKN
jgi:hypothetical protein